jgi:hypothetical protein
MGALSDKTTRKDAELAAAEAEAVKAGMKSFQLGVWRVCVPDTPYGSSSLSPLAKIREQGAFMRASWPYTRRFLAEILSLAPHLVLLSWILDLIEAIIPGISLYFWNLLLTTVRLLCLNTMRRIDSQTGGVGRGFWIDGRQDDQGGAFRSLCSQDCPQCYFALQVLVPQPRHLLFILICLQ